ncbi:putative disease resistance protein RGA4 [Carex rostrata]
MGCLFLSYQHLPPPLQRCFAFCSLFPKGHIFNHDHLVNLWIAEGFIETEGSNEHMKDIGNRYILELISSSFFQVDEWGHYSMHDLIHDLAQDVSEDRDLDALFSKLRKLYVVEIKGICHDTKRVPKSVVQLRNLRYLNLGDINFDAHFVSLCYQLRFLFTKNPIPSVGRLISLQELERGFELKQLEHLKDLYGSLCISGLKNVKSTEEADRAKLSDKKGLRKLHFEWDCARGDIIRDNDEKVLDGLCPPPQIKELAIKNYRGSRVGYIFP